MAKIELTKGKFAIVDDEDFALLNQWRWVVNDNGYASRRFYIKGTGRKNAKNETVYMHRLVNKTPNGFFTDHINRNKLDNRKSNLKTVNKSENARNTLLRKGNRSGIKGCYWEKRVNKWRLQIKVSNKSIHLGYFDDIEKARLARQIAESRYYGQL